MESRIREIFKKEFNSKVLSISKIKEGYSHDMYEVKTDKKPYIAIIRFPINLNPNISLEKGYGRKINEEVLRLNRLLRDISFATALLQSGNRELFPKIIKGIKREIT